MAFWGSVLKPNQKTKVESPSGDILHLSQACLHEPKDGKNYITVDVNGTSLAVACLEKGKKEHDSFDLFFDPKTCSFMNKGQSEVHLTGYFEPNDDDDSDDADMAPPAKAVEKKASPKVEPKKAEVKTSPKVEPKTSPKVDPKTSPKVDPKTSPKVEAAKSPKVDSAKKPPVPEESDSEEEGEEEELLEDESEEEEEEVKEEVAPPGKRKAAAAPPESPAKKKGKPEAQAEPEPTDPVQKYVQDIVKYLKGHGKASFGQLGSKINRPNGVPKFKDFFKQHKDKFVVEGDKVTLKK